jgi:hypothetical protein
MSLKVLPVRLEKALSAETGKLGDLVIAHQKSVQRMASLIDQEPRENGVGERRDAYAKIQQEIEDQLGAHAKVLKIETEKITIAVAANSRLLHKLALQRFLLTVILSYIAGLLTVLIFDELLSFIGPMFH